VPAFVDHADEEEQCAGRDAVADRDDERALAAVERILLIRPDSPEEVRDHGMILARRGLVDEAIAEFEHYLDVLPGAPDATRVRMLIEELAKESSP